MIDRREFILAIGAVAVATDALAGETNPGPSLHRWTAQTRLLMRPQCLYREGRDAHVRSAD